MGKHSEDEKKSKKDPGQETDKDGSQGTDQNLKELQTRLESKEKEASENYEKFMRAVAELDNYKKFAAKEKADLIKYANENIIKDILPILDSLDRALAHAEDSSNIKNFIEGIGIIRGQLLSRLEKYGVEKIESVGKEFDPNLHEAVQTVESSEHEGNLVLEEFEKGYLLNKRLLKAPKVSVSRKKTAPQEDSQEE